MAKLSPSPRNILVRMPNWIGDAVMAMPVLHDLKSQWKDASLTVLCRSNMREIFESSPYVDKTLSFPSSSRFLYFPFGNELFRFVRGSRYDLGILLTNSFSSAYFFCLSGVKNRVGFRGNFRNAFLDKPVSFPPDKEKMHLVSVYKELLKKIGVSISPTLPELHVENSEREKAERILEENGWEKSKTLVGINPGAAYGSAKCWLPERFKALTKKILENPHIHVVYFGDKKGKPLVDEICKDISSRAINLAAQTSVSELAALIERCSLFLSNDSGPMHLASAIGTPLIALFGSTNEVKTGPCSQGIVIHKHVDCSPCYERVCPKDFRCMKNISVSEVYQEMKKLLPSIALKGEME